MSKKPASTAHEHGYAKDKDVLVKRLHRIEGQVRGIERMVADDRSSRAPFSCSTNTSSTALPAP
jgi:hypothetical protein